GSTLAIGIAPSYIAVSQHGWLYAIGGGKLIMRRIESSQRIEVSLGCNDAIESVLAPPTIGADGSFYLVTNQYLYAYPAPPADFALPLWRHRIDAKASNAVSPAALSRDGRTIYVAVGYKASGEYKMKVLALDAASGNEKWGQEGLAITKGENEPMPIPVVAGKVVFLTDKAPEGNTLYALMDRDDNGIRTMISAGGPGNSVT